MRKRDLCTTLRQKCMGADPKSNSLTDGDICKGRHGRNQYNPRTLAQLGFRYFMRRSADVGRWYELRKNGGGSGVGPNVAGMFYAWAMYRRSRVGDAVMAHATTNALIASDVLILGNWNMWQTCSLHSVSFQPAAWSPPWPPRSSHSDLPGNLVPGNPITDSSRRHK